jgi:hypothetical protein
MTAAASRRPDGSTMNERLRGGVVYALVDSAWDGRYAMPFCSIVSDADRDECWTMTIRYMRTVFERQGEDIARDCARLSAGSDRCRRLATSP